MGEFDFIFEGHFFEEFLEVVDGEGDVGLDFGGGADLEDAAVGDAQGSRVWGSGFGQFGLGTPGGG